ncbi:hypothetical protein INT43_003677 [Umbelopsis isabellina]|uniref:Dpy-30 n=1 Tax=Mortierella isabellina TaxID=91625 RepID=A0A8H7PTM7_MORIS|nr:hypothetical protein INT43_003677 [Umbelopsis isabellina]
MTAYLVVETGQIFDLNFRHHNRLKDSRFTLDMENQSGTNSPSASTAAQWSEPMVVQSDHSAFSESQSLQRTPPAAPPPAVTAERPAMDTPPRAHISALNSLPARAYLDETVVPTLLDGMQLLATQRPDDPLHFLGQFLISKSA